MSTPSRAFAGLALFVLACAHHAGVPSRRDLQLAGLTTQLLPEPDVRAAVSGDVQGTYAEVRFEYAEPLSLVTRGCFAKAEVDDSGETVIVPQPTGQERSVALVGIPALSIGGRALGSLRAGLEEDSKRCVVTLGSDVLSPYSIRIDPATRTLSVQKSRSHDGYVEQISSPSAQDGPEEFHLIELTRDPNSDWPLLAIRASQPNAQLTGAFLLSLCSVQSGVVDQAAGEAGLQPRADLFDQLNIPNVKRPAKVAKAFDLQRLELSPGFGLERAALQLLDGWPKPAALGVLGSDIWGHFRITVDPSAGVLLLSRPRVFAAGARQQCASNEAGQISEEACFQLEQLPQSRGVDAVVSVWRDAPEGARVYLELVDETGAPIRSRCRVGVSYLSTDRGASARHRLPWASLEKAMPECFAQLSSAKKVTFGLYEEGSLRECPGQCAFVNDVVTGRVSCECATAAMGMSEAERRFVDMYKQLMERAKQKGATEKKKPDPDDEGPEDDPQK